MDLEPNLFLNSKKDFIAADFTYDIIEDCENFSNNVEGSIDFHSYGVLSLFREVLCKTTTLYLIFANYL